MHRWSLGGSISKERYTSQAEKAEKPHKINGKAGAARGIRTPDPVITNDVLYRLSYCGNLAGTKAMPAPIRALLISGMARIGKDKRGSN